MYTNYHFTLVTLSFLTFSNNTLASGLFLKCYLTGSINSFIYLIKAGFNASGYNFSAT